MTLIQNCIYIYIYIYIYVSAVQLRMHYLKLCVIEMLLMLVDIVADTPAVLWY